MITPYFIRIFHASMKFQTRQRHMVNTLKVFHQSNLGHFWDYLCIWAILQSCSNFCDIEVKKLKLCNMIITSYQSYFHKIKLSYSSVLVMSVKTIIFKIWSNFDEIWSSGPVLIPKNKNVKIFHKTLVLTSKTRYFSNIVQF